MTAQGRGRRRLGTVALVVAACFIVSFVSLGTSATSGATGAARTGGLDRAHPTSYCTNPQRQATVVGKPDLHSVPSLAGVTVTPYDGGLVVSFVFQHRLVTAPAGVLISWRVFIYRTRHDVDRSANALVLNVEDRGAGWEPSGWTITTALGTALALVDGNVILNRARDELSALFPKGFGNMRTPFYWYANEWEIRSFLPTKNPNKPNYSVNGSESFDCPSGTDASGTPDPKLLLHATG